MLRIDLSSEVAGSGETFNSVAFSCISPAYPPNPHPDPLPEGEGMAYRVPDRGREVPRLRGNVRAYDSGITYVNNVATSGAMA